ncbi:MAG: sigma-54 dependent transcriptional regulator [Planctomycetota bacterium]
MKRTGRVLLVEDDRENCLMLKEVLTKWNHSVTDVCSGEDAVARAEKEPFDVVLTDIRMGRVDGLAVLRAFRRLQPDAPVIVMTGFGSIDTAVSAMNAGAFDYISKPFKFDEIRLTLERALEQRESKGAVAESPEKDEGLVTLLGHSRAMAEIYKTIAQVAKGRSTVLIQGESGTGKELVARAIHRHSDRSERPFVAINCAALPDTLLESELFGYAKGAHSTAMADKPGLFEAASGGTLFLDEVGDTSLSLQAKLLRAIEESETRRLGDMRTIRTDVRVLASTNKDISSMARDGKFRGDLYYRLNVVTIVLPPLRDRREDIPALVGHFLAKYNAIFHKNVASASAAVLACFQKFPWMGNVRELENVVERAVILNTKSTIEMEDLPESIRSPQAREGVMSLADMERKHIEQVLTTTKGNMKAAAELLGIDRKTLYRKCSEYGIEVVRE